MSGLSGWPPSIVTGPSPPSSSPVAHAVRRRGMAAVTASSERGRGSGIVERLLVHRATQRGLGVSGTLLLYLRKHATPTWLQLNNTRVEGVSGEHRRYCAECFSAGRAGGPPQLPGMGEE